MRTPTAAPGNPAWDSNVDLIQPKSWSVAKIQDFRHYAADGYPRRDHASIGLACSVDFQRLPRSFARGLAAYLVGVAVHAG